MLVNYNVQGTQENVPTLEINVDTVYLRSNIKQKINEEGQLYWEYDEFGWRHRFRPLSWGLSFN